MTTANTQDLETPDRLLHPALRSITLGLLALVFLGAFEQLAVTTIMPAIADDLDGHAWYAMAFTVTLASTIAALSMAGTLSDRRGPALPLGIGVVLQAAGLVLAAVAPTMAVFLIARVLQGFGGGMAVVALYVVAAQAFPGALQTKIFAAFATAWLLPSMVGPVLAGAIEHAWGWRWVFGAALGVLLASAVMLRPVMTGPPLVEIDDEHAPWPLRSIALSLVVAGAVVAVNAAADADGVARLLGLAGLVVAALAVRPLLPPGTLLPRRGLPAPIAMRGLMFATFAGAEIYVPRLLVEERGLTPTQAGLALTLAGVGWCLASAAQGRWELRLPLGLMLGTAATLLVVGTGLGWLVAIAGAPAWLLMLGWTFVGVGMGTAYPRLTAVALGQTPRGREGFVSSALQTVDAVGASAALAVSAILFAALGSSDVDLGYAACFAMSAACAALALVISRRVMSGTTRL